MRVLRLLVQQAVAVLFVDWVSRCAVLCLHVLALRGWHARLQLCVYVCVFVCTCWGAVGPHISFRRAHACPHLAWLSATGLCSLACGVLGVMRGGAGGRALWYGRACACAVGLAAAAAGKAAAAVGAGDCSFERCARAFSDCHEAAGRPAPCRDARARPAPLRGVRAVAANAGSVARWILRCLLRTRERRRRPAWERAFAFATTTNHTNKPKHYSPPFGPSLAFLGALVRAVCARVAVGQGMPCQ